MQIFYYIYLSEAQIIKRNLTDGHVAYIYNVNDSELGLADAQVACWQFEFHIVDLLILLYLLLLISLVYAGYDMSNGLDQRVYSLNLMLAIL